MLPTIACPRCSQPVNSQARHCEHCGVDLALAAVLAEHRLKLQEDLPDGIPLTPEILVPRLGDYLVEKGVLEAGALDQALAYQKKKTDSGQPILLGQALRELGLVDPETLDQAITVQILQLQTALRQSNEQLEQRVQERTSELQAAITQLQQLSQLKANFVANISHELRTPLTHIKGYLDILAEAGLGPLNPQQMEVVSVLQRAEARLERLIDDLIQFAYASKGELTLNTGPVNLTDLARRVVNQRRQKAEDSAISLGIRLPEDLPLVICDEEKIYWVLSQFLDNALKFTPKGGRVLIEAFRKDGQVTVAVSDTGIGIPAGRLAEIFEPFHQLDSSSKRRYAGTGLGLALSQRILQAHGSEIEIHSLEGKGSRFAFTLAVFESRISGEEGPR